MSERVCHAGDAMKEFAEQFLIANGPTLMPTIIPESHLKDITE